MSRIALISDIHGNLDALEAVLADIETYEIEQIACLGDIVGYGGAPRECVEIVQQRCSPIVMGNHEVFTLLPIDTGQLGGGAGRGVEKAREELSEDQLDWLSRLPLVDEIAGATIVHASLDEPCDFNHILKLRQAKRHFKEQTTTLCFNGHTHQPIIIEKVGRYIESCKPPEGFIGLNPANQQLVNVGSVGQPRDYDPRACYVIYDTEMNSVSFERVDYDIKRAQRRFEEAEMHPSVIKRIAKGQ